MRQKKKFFILLHQGTENTENTEEIQLKTTPQPPKSEKRRIKNIRFSFTPSNLSVRTYIMFSFFFFSIILK